jgi:hypothetical protein
MGVASAVGLAVAIAAIIGRTAIARPITGLVQVAAAISRLAGIAPVWRVTVIARRAVIITLITTVGLAVISLSVAIGAAIVIAARQTAQ